MIRGTKRRDYEGLRYNCLVLFVFLTAMAYFKSYC